MNATFKLSPDAVISADAPSKRAVFDQLATLFAQVYGLDRSIVLEALEEREALGSTGFGRGVALPHARLEGLRRPVAALVRLVHPIEFASADGLPVDLVVGLLSPANAGATHLHALAEISRMVRCEETRQALGDAANEEELFALLTNASDRDAA